MNPSAASRAAAQVRHQRRRRERGAAPVRRGEPALVLADARRHVRGARDGREPVRGGRGGALARDAARDVRRAPRDPRGRGAVRERSAAPGRGDRCDARALSGGGGGELCARLAGGPAMAPVPAQASYITGITISGARCGARQSRGAAHRACAAGSGDRCSAANASCASCVAVSGCGLCASSGMCELGAGSAHAGGVSCVRGGWWGGRRRDHCDVV